MTRFGKNWPHYPPRNEPPYIEWKLLQALDALEAAHTASVEIPSALRSMPQMSETLKKLRQDVAECHDWYVGLYR